MTNPLLCVIDREAETEHNVTEIQSVDSVTASLSIAGKKKGFVNFFLEVLFYRIVEYFYFCVLRTCHE